jgi:hypothetical protein
VHILYDVPRALCGEFDIILMWQHQNTVLTVYLDTVSGLSEILITVWSLEMAYWEDIAAKAR